jgi:hypothetical protein
MSFHELLSLKRYMSMRETAYRSVSSVIAISLVYGEG